ncbi:hypothetical protein ABZX61_20510, partial [Nonomuraea sp. NPDC003709]
SATLPGKRRETTGAVLPTKRREANSATLPGKHRETSSTTLPGKRREPTAPRCPARRPAGHAPSAPPDWPRRAAWSTSASRSPKPPAPSKSTDPPAMQHLRDPDQQLCHPHPASARWRPSKIALIDDGCPAVPQPPELQVLRITSSRHAPVESRVGAGAAQQVMFSGFYFLENQKW